MITVGSEITAISCCTQLLESVTVKLWFPAAKFKGFCPNQFSVNGGNPPEIVRIAVPSLYPKQDVNVVFVIIEISVGSEIVKLIALLHPFKSVTKTL